MPEDVLNQDTSSVRKIGILTRHCYPNYGSLLQAYALTCAFREAGADASVINYIPNDDTPVGLPAASLRESRMRNSRARRLAFFAVQGPNFYMMAKRFASYQRDLLALTERVNSHDGIANVVQGFDDLVVGSDQVWNRIHGKLDPAYFFETIALGVRFHSYAASFGTAGPKSIDRSYVKDRLAEFDNVSVREDSAQVVLGELAVDSRVDVDPVLLHSRDFWEEYASGSRRRGGYILVYQLHNTPDFDKVLRAVAARHSMPVVRVSVDAKQLLFRGRARYLTTPKSFVASFRDAAYVVTDSFHGTAFSLLFGIPIYPVLPERNSERMIDLLRSVGLARLAQGAQSRGFLEPEYDANRVGENIRSQAMGSWSYIRALARGENA